MPTSKLRSMCQILDNFEDGATIYSIAKRTKLYYTTVYNTIIVLKQKKVLLVDKKKGLIINPEHANLKESAKYILEILE